MPITSVQRSGPRKFCHHFPRRLYRIVILHAFEIFRRDQILRTDAHTKKSNAHTAEHAHRIRLHAALERRPAHVVVAGNKIEVRKLHRRRERVHAVVKIMIAERDDVVANQRHRLVLNFAFVEIEIRRALENVAGINQKRVRILLANRA